MGWRNGIKIFRFFACENTWGRSHWKGVKSSVQFILILFFFFWESDLIQAFTMKVSCESSNNSHNLDKYIEGGSCIR